MTEEAHERLPLFLITSESSEAPSHCLDRAAHYPRSGTLASEQRPCRAPTPQEDNVQKITVKSVCLIAVALSALMTSVFATGAQGGKVNVKADTLTGYQETPTISSTGTGIFTAEIDEDAGVITYELTY